ncbi:MAG TPA: transposase, partial [Draconibacterium sp.]|nr:transposase [Draconibacterium sp.]
MKVQRIYESSLEINFNSPRQEFSLYWKSFLASEIGKIYVSIPWNDLVRHFKIEEYKKGPSRFFSPQGMIALMILKSYVGCSDRKLIEHLNGNINFQLFCDIWLQGERLTNFKIVSQIRTFLSAKLAIAEAQKILAKHWKPYIEHPNIMLTDATCYETAMRYPTNVKLLWESVDWSYGQLKIICKYLKIRIPRTKYLKQKDRYSNYSRKRRKSKKERRVLTRSLLHLLDKLLFRMKEIERNYPEKFTMPDRYYRQIKIITTVLSQQQEIFRTGVSVPDRIVSLSKSYIRPIVRGKEVKPVEFGAKVNMIQFGGINFIEHISFSAFHEGIRLKQSVRYGRELVGKITHLSGDDIYATNANRTYCKKENITHGFKRKGRAGKHEQHRKILHSVLRKERATRMEGSFGTEKEHYGLKKIRAMTQKNEELCIFFGVHTANAVRIAKKMAREKSQKA